MSHMFTTSACKKELPELVEKLKNLDTSNDSNVAELATEISSWFNNNRYPRWDCHGALLRKFFELSKNGMNADKIRLKEDKFKTVYKINEKIQKIGSNTSKSVWNEQFAHRCADRYARTGNKRYYKDMEKYYKSSHLLGITAYRQNGNKNILKYVQTSLYWLAWQYVRFQDYSKAKSIYMKLYSYSGPKYFYKHSKILLAKRMSTATIEDFIEFRSKAQESHGLIGNDKYKRYPK